MGGIKKHSPLGIKQLNPLRDGFSVKSILDPGGLMQDAAGLRTQAQDIPDPTAPPAPPSYDTAAQKAIDDADSVRRRNGRASTILAGGSTGSLSPNIGTKQLLGA